MHPIRPTLNKIVRDALARASEQDAPIFAWPLACGSAVAAKTEAVRFEKGILHVVVPDATWKAQLEDLSSDLLAKLCELVGPAVERIEFIVAGQRSVARASFPVR